MAFRAIKLSLAWEPLDIINWDKAFNLVYFYENPKADVLWTYPEDKVIRSQYLSWKYPSIIVLKAHVRRRPEKIVSPSLRAILVRDLYTCQYCGCRLTNTTGTRDHVVPRSLGGPNSFNNLVACCRACQAIKGDRHPDDCGMKPKKAPKVPILSERFSSAVKCSSSEERSSWKSGLRHLGLDHLIMEG